MNLRDSAMVRMTIWLGLLLCSGVGTQAWAVPANAEAEQTVATKDASARTVVNASSSALLALIEESRPWAKSEPERFYAEVESILAPAVDFRMFARNVMWKHYATATPAQRKRFAESFKWSLVRTYALALTEFNGGEVKVLPADRPSKRPDRDRVKMEIRTDAGEVYPLIYSMRQGKDGQWRVFNVVVNGVNMGLTFRSQFDAAMQDNQYAGDVDQVIDAWTVQGDATGG